MTASPSKSKSELVEDRFRIFTRPVHVEQPDTVAAIQEEITAMLNDGWKIVRTDVVNYTEATVMFWFAMQR